MKRLVQLTLIAAAIACSFVILQSTETQETKGKPSNFAARTMLSQIELRIAAQEDVKDVRCWSSVNKIQSFLSGMPIEVSAISHRVEEYVTLIDSIWLRANAKADGPEIGNATLISVLEQRFPQQVSMRAGRLTFDFANQHTPVMVFEDSVEDYGDTIESWRLLQSWAFRKANASNDTGGPELHSPFSVESLNTFREFLVVFDTALLQKASTIARERKLASIDDKSMELAFDRLLGMTVQPVGNLR